jgi:hypothetical protein
MRLEYTFLLVVVIEDLKIRDRKNMSIVITLGEKAKEEK